MGGPIGLVAAAGLVGKAGGDETGSGNRVGSGEDGVVVAGDSAAGVVSIASLSQPLKINPLTKITAKRTNKNFFNIRPPLFVCLTWCTFTYALILATINVCHPKRLSSHRNKAFGIQRKYQTFSYWYLTYFSIK